MREPIPAIVMLPPAGRSAAEHWLAAARSAAAEDLIRRLVQTPEFEPVLLLAAEEADHRRLTDLGARSIAPSEGRFHFGAALAEVATSHRFQRLAYFGGASAPLLGRTRLEELARSLSGAGERSAIVNNLHSTDWMLMNDASALGALRDRFPTDNTLGWVLAREAGFAVESLPPSAATRADIDTPADVLLMARHPELGPAMSGLLAGAPAEQMERRHRFARLLSEQERNLALIGRVEPSAWARLSESSRAWVRVFSEERGMVASRRLERGEVRSLIHNLVQHLGAFEFVAQLSALVDGVLWDTRVWMAARGPWPPPADRYAADLGWIDQIDDPELRELTQAIAEAPIPILTGGHGLVSGSLLALLESEIG